VAPSCLGDYGETERDVRSEDEGVGWVEGVGGFWPFTESELMGESRQKRGGVSPSNLRGMSTKKRDLVEMRLGSEGVMTTLSNDSPGAKGGGEKCSQTGFKVGSEGGIRIQTKGQSS